MNTTGEDGQKRKWQRIEKRKSEREREEWHKGRRFSHNQDLGHNFTVL